MGSTLKIATSNRGVHGVPVIKIIQPLSLVSPSSFQDIELKDELIASFLHTPCMAHPNGLFRVDTRFDAEADGVRVTTISAVEEGQMFHTFKHAIFDRLISYSNLCDCVQFDKRPKGSGNHGPVPFDWDKYLKIKDFFDWVWEQPYNGDPVNTPIETRRDTQRTPAPIPRETIRDYFELDLEQSERMAAFQNTNPKKLDFPAINITDAINSAFVIKNTPEGADYWQMVIDRVNNLKS